MPEKKALNEDLFYKGSSANLPRFGDFKEFDVTKSALADGLSLEF